MTQVDTIMAAAISTLSTVTHIAHLAPKCDAKTRILYAGKTRGASRRHEAELRPLSCFSSLKKRRLANGLATKRELSQAPHSGLHLNSYSCHPAGCGTQVHASIMAMDTQKTELYGGLETHRYDSSRLRIKNKRDIFTTNCSAEEPTLQHTYIQTMPSSSQSFPQHTSFVFGRQSTTPSGLPKSSIYKRTHNKVPCVLYHRQWSSSGLMLSSASTAIPSTDRGDGQGLSGSNMSHVVPSDASTITTSYTSYHMPSMHPPVVPVTPTELLAARGDSQWHSRFPEATNSRCAPRVTPNVPFSAAALKLKDTSSSQTDLASSLQVPSNQELCQTLVVTPTRPQPKVAKHNKEAVTEKVEGYRPESQFEVDDGYIVTPGKHRININSFLMQADQQMQAELRTQQPAAAAMASYAQDIYTEWRASEQQLDRKIFQLAFHPSSDIERFRQMALHCILQYARDADLSGSTAHCSIHNVHRVLLHYVQQLKVRLTANMFFGTIAACLRMALKHEETPEKTRPFRDSPTATLWKSLGLDDAFLTMNSSYLNKVEVDCLKILENPLTPPSGPDYLDRYLTVGGWPASSVVTYRDIALYLVNLALFSRRDTDQLAGLPPSLLAASALALGIKVISAGKGDGYEFWPQRLVVYSGYTIADLRPGVRGLSALLRSKPPGSDILEHFHPVWARYDWK